MATVYEWMNDLRRAVELYRADDTEAALVQLRERRTSELRLVSTVLAQWVERPYVAPIPRDARGRPVQQWTTADVRALAALEMEAALRVYLARTRKTPPEDVWAYILASEPLFASLRAKEPAHAEPLPRWKLAIGLTALADGEHGWAAALLDRASGEHPDDVGLLIAHASVHEAIAMQPAHVLLSEGRVGTNEAPVSFDADSYRAARAARARRLTTARRALESALHHEPYNPEAALRLAHLHILHRNLDEAASRLEDLLTGGLALNVRSTYLARVFLARVRSEQERYDEAVALFRAAVDGLPEAQSAYVGLMHALIARGTAREIAGVSRRMMAAVRDDGDPWWGYAFGQFWAIEPLLLVLRQEARR